MRAEILKYDVNAPREQGFSNQRMYPDNRHGAARAVSSCRATKLERQAMGPNRCAAWEES